MKMDQSTLVDFLMATMDQILDLQRRVYALEMAGSEEAWLRDVTTVGNA
jgi:hypothetical protein